MNQPRENISHNQAVGRWGEQLAEEYLKARGYQILHRNFRTQPGEIDIIALHDDQIVFIEVKTRTRLENGSPESALTPKKVAHLLNSAQAYLEENPESPQDWKIEVVAISG